MFYDANIYIYLISSFCFQFRESRFAIKDYFLHCLKLRVASHNLWKSSTPRTDLCSFLLSAARALFQQVLTVIAFVDSFTGTKLSCCYVFNMVFCFQIIHTHRKTFDADKYAAIKSFLSSSQKAIASVCFSCEVFC